MRSISTWILGIALAFNGLADAAARPAAQASAAFLTLRAAVHLLDAAARREHLRAIVARDLAALPQEVVLAVRFTDASLRHVPETDGLRDEVVRQWGGLISLAFAMVAARIYPTLKYAFGHGISYTRLRIGNDSRPVQHEVTRAA